MAISVRRGMGTLCFFNMPESIPIVILFKAKTVGKQMFMGFALIGSILIFITSLYKDTHRISIGAFYIQQVAQHTMAYKVQYLFEIDILSFESLAKHNRTGIGFN